MGFNYNHYSMSFRRRYRSNYIKLIHISKQIGFIFYIQLLAVQVYSNTTTSSFRLAMLAAFVIDFNLIAISKLL